MAFTLDQNVQGAAAFGESATPTASAGLSVAGGLLGLLDNFARAELASDKAIAVAARANAPTQTEEDRAAFKSLILKARQEITGGKTKEQAAADYALDLANLGLDATQQAVATQVFGEDVFSIPVQTVNRQDTITALFNSLGEPTRLGLMAVEKKKAALEGKAISDDAAYSLAVGNYATQTAQSQAGIVAGNTDWQSGYVNNMQTLDKFSEAMYSAIEVEVSGKNFNIENTARMYATFQMLKTQVAFSEPSGTVAKEQWQQMKTKIDGIDNLFVLLKDYDKDFVADKTAALAANIALNLAEDNPLVLLAFNDADTLAGIAADNAAIITKELTESKGRLDNVVSYDTLDFDPVVLRLMGLEDTTAAGAGTTASNLASDPSIFPTALREQYAPALADQKEAVAELGSTTAVLSSCFEGIVDTPAGLNVWATSIAKCSFILSELKAPSTTNLDALFSPKNIKNLNLLQVKGGQEAETATLLRSQMAAALGNTARKYSIAALGETNAVPGLKIDSVNLSFVLDKNSELQPINAVAELYYGGNFEALWKDGPLAFEKLKNALAETGRITPDSPEYASFLEGTKSINPARPESVLWRGLAPLYSSYSGILPRLKQLKDFGKALDVDTGIDQILKVDRVAIDEAVAGAVAPRIGNTEAFGLIEEGETFRDTEGKLRTRPVTPKGTRENPLVINWVDLNNVEANEKLFSGIGDGVYFLDPSGTPRRKPPRRAN